MNLLFLKPRVSVLLLLVNLALIGNANTSNTPATSPDFRDQLLNADAYIVY